LSQLLTDKDVVGRETWGVLHRYAAKYPEKPTKKDKDEFHTFFKAILRQIPDGDCKCRTHAVEYVMKHKPDTSSRYGLSMYLCDFHNDINRILGKEQKNCTTMMRDYGIECTSCGIKRESRQVPINIFSDFKQISIKVFEEFCKREDLPVPHIIFSPCPTDKSTSCVNMKWNEQTNEVAKDVRSKVYINPASFGLRTLIHELVEYKRQMKSEKRLPEDEEAVEKEVQDIIMKEFPHDAEGEILKPTAVYKDGYSSSFVTGQPSSYQPFQYLKKFRANMSEQFPTYTTIRKKYSSTLTAIEESPTEIVETTVHQEREYSGVLSYFDGIYEPFAKFTGVRARDLNRSNTPTIFSNGVMAIARSNLTEFGSLLFSTVFGMAMFMATVFTNRETIGFEDKRLLTQLGGNFVWNGVQYSNPKIAPELIAQAQLFVASVMNQRFDKIGGSIIQTPSDVKALSAEQDAVQNAANQRSSERATGRSPSGGGGSGARSSQRGGIPDTNQPALNSIEAQNIVQRARERSEGLQRPPEDPSNFRNFGAGNIFIKPGPHPGFTYVPTISSSSGIDDYLLDAENGGGTIGVNPNVSTRALQGISQEELSELGIM